MSILDTIFEQRRVSVDRQKRAVSPNRARLLAGTQPPPPSLAAALGGAGVGVIAEIKRRSPSAGVLKAAASASAQARLYAANGAAAISVLTEREHFGGSYSDLVRARRAVAGQPVPLLCKDFIFDPYQVHRARAAGAAAILLIAALLEEADLRSLLALAATLGMDALVEVHDEADLARALAAGAPIIGINNRDLRTFQVDLGTTARLRPQVPRDRLVVSESGFRRAEDVAWMRALGVQAVLVGETLMRAPDPAAALRELVEAGRPA